MSSFDYGKRGSYRRPNTLVLSDLYKPIRAFVKGEGDDAFVRVRSWNMLKSEPGPPTGRVLARGDLVRVFNFERVAPDGTPYVSVMSMRRWVAGVVPKDSLSDTHPLVDLAEDLKSLVHTKSGADHDFDAAFNEVSCTRGAYKIQNWLRGHVTAEGIDEARPGPLKELRGARAMADALRRNALTGRRKVVEFYVKPDKSRVTDPSNPHTPLWPGDLVTLSRNRYWDSKTKDLTEGTLLPDNTALADIQVLDADYDEWARSTDGSIWQQIN